MSSKGNSIVILPETDKALKAFQSADEHTPLQMTLFKDFSSSQNYTNALSFHDMIPKFVYNKSAKILTDAKPSDMIITQPFKFLNQAFQVTIKAALLERKDKNNNKIVVAAFNGKREEAIYNILLKIATTAEEDRLKYKEDRNGKGVYWIDYTLNEIKRYLEEYKKTGSIAEIKESLTLLNTVQYSTMMLSSSNLDENNHLDGALLPQLIARPYQKSSVQVSELVSREINTIPRKYNFDLKMYAKHVLTKHMIERLAGVFTQAQVGTPYRLNATTLYENAGVSWDEKRSSNNLRTLQNMGKELVDGISVDQIAVGEKCIFTPIKKGRKIIDYRIELYLTEQWIEETIKANRIKLEGQNALKQTESRENIIDIIPVGESEISQPAEDPESLSLNTEEESLNKKVEQDFIKYGVSLKQTQIYLEKHDIHYLQDCIIYFEDKYHKKNKARDPEALLGSIIKGGYAERTPEERKALQTKQNSTQKQAAEEKANAAKDAAEKKENDRKIRIIKKHLSKLSIEEDQKAQDEFINYLEKQDLQFVCQQFKDHHPRKWFGQANDMTRRMYRSHAIRFWEQKGIGS